MDESKDFILELLRNQLFNVADDLRRAKSQFKNLSDGERESCRFGGSEQTPNQIIAGYAKRFEQIQSAQEWVNKRQR